MWKSTFTLVSSTNFIVTVPVFFCRVIHLKKEKKTHVSFPSTRKEDVVGMTFVSQHTT